MRFDKPPHAPGGSTWDRDRSEREVIEDLVRRLADKDALTKSYASEMWAEVNASILEIRGWLSTDLERLREGSEAYRLVEQLRSGCRGYLRASGQPREHMMSPEAAEALSALRETFRVKLRYLAGGGKLPTAAQLADRIEPLYIPRS